LKNQNPINPTDTDQMTQELIGLSQLEQQMSSNTLLSSMKSSLNDISAANGLGYIGSSVVANGSTAPLVNDSATWDYTLANTAKTTTLTIENSSGQTVWTGTGSTASGSHTLNWDGLATNGTTQEAAGAYTLYVSAVDSSGKAITTSTQITGTVTGVDNSSGSANLILGNSVTVAQSSVVGVSSSSSTASTSSTSSTSGS
jgi:flagellar basal-body rod modification protein FlgD